MKIKNITLFLLTLFLASCDKYLDVSPDSRTNLDGVDKVKDLLVTAYPLGSYITFAEAASDNAADKGPNAQGILLYPINEGPYLFKDVDSEIGRDSPTYYWYACYKAIAAANHALDAIEKATDDKKAYQPYKGEALVCRAYAHFMLVTFFSRAYVPGQPNPSPGIPYVTRPEKEVQPKYERKTVDYVYEMIEKDLTEGLKLIKNTVYEVPKFHFTTSAAHAFASRFYLFKKQYDKVIEHANQVTTGGDFSRSLRPWITEYNNLAETAEIRNRYGNSGEVANILLVRATTHWGSRNYLYRYGLAYQLNQQRMRWPNVTGGVWDQRTSSYNSSTNIRHNKFTSDTYVVPLLCMEEVLFNRAEAYACTGQYDKAMADMDLYASTRTIGYNSTTNKITLQKIRDYYKTTNDLEGMVATVLDFKRSEFIMEGIRWFDILRHGITVTHTVLDGAGNVVNTITVDKNDPRRVFQIPFEAKLAGIDLNPR